jgi:hypothetical protein
VNGGSASKISLIVPIAASPKWSSNALKNFRAATSSPGCTLSQASMKGPSSQGHTVPSW